MSAQLQDRDPFAAHLVGQASGALVLLDDIRTRLGSLSATLSDVAAALVNVPGLDAKAALVIGSAIEGEIEQLERVRDLISGVRATLARAALKDAASLGRALRA